MKWTGESLESNPPQHPHKCTNDDCPAEVPDRYVRIVDGDPYPRIVHEVDEEVVH